MNTENTPLPRLAYVGEVPVRNISAGPALLYRLLETYPQDRLLLLESDHNRRNLAVELPNVCTVPFHLLSQRWARTRFAQYVGAWIYLNAGRRGRGLASTLRAFGAEAILTVTHGYGPLAAAAAARFLRLPLHIIAHDDWLGTIMLHPQLRHLAERDFGNIYRSAASRMPVSPDMNDYYHRRYGTAGRIIYPSRPRNHVRLSSPPFRVPPQPGFTFAYAGSAASSGQRRALAVFANAIASCGSKLRIYQNLTLQSLREVGLTADNAEIAAFRPVSELHEDLINSVDALYLPMSFAPEDRANVELCFPSKLADYTVAGLPILVRAPQYGTAAQWARENPSAAALITDEHPRAIQQIVAKLISDTPYRHALAREALRIGKSMFDHTVVTSAFHAELCSFASASARQKS